MAVGVDPSIHPLHYPFKGSGSHSWAACRSPGWLNVSLVEVSTLHRLLLRLNSFSDSPLLDLLTVFHAFFSPSLSTQSKTSGFYLSVSAAFRPSITVFFMSFLPSTPPRALFLPAGLFLSIISSCHRGCLPPPPSSCSRPLSAQFGRQSRGLMVTWLRCQAAAALRRC